MPITRLTVLVAASVLWSVGCRPAPPSLTAEEAAGQRLYQSHCAHCHEENDLALKPPPPTLAKIFVRGVLPSSGLPATDQQIQRTVLEGKGNMPSFAGRFTPEQMETLIAYLHTGLR